MHFHISKRTWMHLDSFQTSSSQTIYSTHSSITDHRVGSPQTLRRMVRVLSCLKSLQISGLLRLSWIQGSRALARILINQREILHPEDKASHPPPPPGGVPQVFDALSDDIYAISVRGREPQNDRTILKNTGNTQPWKIMISKSSHEH